MIILAIAIALGMPRFAEDEFVLTVRWDHEIAGVGERGESAAVYQYAEISGLLARGSSAIGVFHPGTGELLYFQRRHPVFTYSDDYYLNQIPLESSRWAVIDRRSGAPSFLERHGVPRLYGPVLVQAGTSALTLQHVKHPRVVRLPNQGNLTTVAVSTAGVSGVDTSEDITPGDSGSGSVLVATGDIFGVVELLAIDFLTGRRETILSVNITSADGRGPSVVYGVQLETGDPAQLIVLHGHEPQVLETLSIPSGRVRLRQVVPDEYRLVSPPVVQRLDDSTVVFGLRGALMFADLREDALWTIPADTAGAFFGVLPVSETILALVSGHEGDLVLSLRESPRSESDAATWRFRDVYPTAAERGLLVVESEERFIALEVAP
jgi:hypothetical protein